MKLIFYPLCPRCVEEQLPSNQPFSKIDHQKIPLMKINMLQELEEFINKQSETTINDTDNNNNNNTPTSPTADYNKSSHRGNAIEMKNQQTKKKIACNGFIESHWLKRENILFGLPSSINHGT